MTSSEDNDTDYIDYDSGGYPFNKEFPPDVLKYGDDFYGYPSVSAGTIFYDCMVQGYGITFSFGNKDYVIPEGENNKLVNLTDKTNSVFESIMDLVKTATIDGIPLMTLINENRLENVDIQ
ncbi:MAG: hypothetical protein HUJ83_08385 [Veillonella sp.]|nr:hypothetical protein [Veillonella sp.]